MVDYNVLTGTNDHFLKEMDTFDIQKSIGQVLEVLEEK